MAQKDASKPAAAAEPPKPVHIGGESFLDRIRPHIKQILVGAVAVAVIASAIALVSHFRQRKQEDATEKLDAVLEVAQRPIRGKDEKVDPAKPSFADAKERANAILDAMTKQGTELAGAAYRGGLLLDAGKPDEAIAEYKKGAADKTTEKTIEGVLCREGLGLALEAKAAAEKDVTARQKGFEDALAAFAAEQPDDTGPRYAYALYHQGRLQQLLGKRTEAKALFDKAKTANKEADRELADQIEKRLAALGAT
jgi:predicted negative regulator of RcsB-dependent stress response